MLTPDVLPKYMRDKVTVTHAFPDEWDEAEIELHRYDECPCVPLMVQQLRDPDCSCGHGTAYWWRVYHRRIEVPS